MELYGTTICVTFDELVGGGILSKPSYDKYVRQGRLEVVQKGGNGRKALIAYAGMPPAVLRAYNSRHPHAKEDMEKQLNCKKLESKLKEDPKATAFFRDFEPKISLDRQEALVLNARVLNAMAKTEHDMKIEHSKAGFVRPRLVKDGVLALCADLRTRYGHTLPRSEARLWEKFTAYKRDGYRVLVDGNTGNQSARKVGPTAGRILLRLKRSHFPQYTDRQIFDEYNRIAAEKGLPVIASPQTVVNYLYRPDVKLWWFAEVHGQVAFKNEFMPQFDTRLPSLPNALWYGDGTRLNLYYRAWDERQKRMVARTIDVYEVMDACTEVFLGCAFGPENFRSQYEAYRMAVETWKVKPYEIVTDNQGGHKKEEARQFFRRICHLHKTTMPHNGQSKSIESAFGRFQQQVLHKLYNFTGQNITARKQDSHANIELIMANIAQLPTLEEMKQQYLACRREWNEAVHPTSETGLTRLELQTGACHPEAEPMDDYQTAEVFRLMSKASVKYGKHGFVFEIDRKEYRYMVYGDDGLVDMDFHLSNIGNSFRYRYDPHDMTLIELWQETATGLKYAATATPKVAVHRATADRTDAENRHLFAQLQANRRALVGHYLSSEELLLEDFLGEAGSRLVIPRPVGIGQKKMEEYRREYEEGRLLPPVAQPDIAPYEPEDTGIASLGEYTKAASRLTDAEMYEDFI